MPLLYILLYDRRYPFLCKKQSMQIVVRCSEAQREELCSTGVKGDADLVWVFEKVELLTYRNADAVVDLLFENEKTNIGILQQVQGLRIINSVCDTGAETDLTFIRINGWPTFLKAPIIESSCRHEDLKKKTESVFSNFNKSIEWLPDASGFVVPRVVSMIINEAYFALAEGVSTRDEIDLAMKLGTAYPFGPFEWSEKIGLKNIIALLTKLSRQLERYRPAPLLLEQADLI